MRLCDFRFSSSEPWDWTIPGLFYEQIRDSFPNKHQVNVIETRVDQSESKIVQQSQTKMQFISQDGTAVIHVGPDNLSIHQLPPYNGWVDMPPLSTEKVVMHVQDMGFGEPLAILDPLPEE